MAMHLLSWIGTADYNAWRNDCREGDGPLLAVARHVRASYLEVLWDDGSNKVPLSDSESYSKWLRRQLAGTGLEAQVRIRPCSDAKVVEFGWVYQQLEALRREIDLDGAFVNASSGTPVMYACWIVFKKATGLNLQLFRSSVEQGVQPIDLPPNLTIDITEIVQGRRSALFERYARGELQLNLDAFRDLISQSERMKESLLKAQLVAKFTDVAVLLLGPPGSGKSRLAKMIHDLSGLNKDAWVTVDCGTLTGERSIAELWGWEKGAFTGADKQYAGLIKGAENGSVFFDEIGNTPPMTQQNLLRLLQEKKYRRAGSSDEHAIDTRVIAATNSDLRHEVRQGRFRQDLFDRLSVFVINVPSLKERAADIVPLAQALLLRFNRVWGEEIEKRGGRRKVFARNAERELQRYDWPGNVRELENVVIRLAILTISQADSISADDVRDELNSLASGTGSSLLDEPLGDGFELERVLNKVRFHYVRRAYVESNRVETKMAELLGWDKRNRTPLKTLRKKLRDAGYNLELGTDS